MSGTRLKKVALALQGGGSHGALTWGVLDRLLEDEMLEIIGVTGTSAGAMNAICLADGLVRGGPQEARRELRTFWEAVGKMPGVGSLLWWLPGRTLAHMRVEQTPPYMALDTIRRNLTPDQFNPTRVNPLREQLAKMIDIDRLRNADLIVQVCATNIRTAMRRVFSNEDISVDAVLASAALPDLFPPVEIEGEAYWDGGFTGNPPMVTLTRKLPKCDFIIVRVDPIMRHDLPTSARDIHDRVLELSFNATFWLELSVLGAMLALVEEGVLDRERWGRIFFHAIDASEELEKIPPSTKLNNAPALLDYLFDLGRTTADAWIAKRGADIGQRSTIDMKKLLSVKGAEVLRDASPRSAATGAAVRAVVRAFDP